jgi:thiol-disulfide isomerase/thioredoxin
VRSEAPGERAPRSLAARRSARAAALLLAIPLALLACRDAPPSSGDAPLERFEGVRRQAGAPAAAQTAFCEKSYPAGARRFTAPPERPLPGAAAPAAAGWRWVNLWATWCTPCVEEMALLRQWRDGFAREGVPVAFELYSIDEADKEKDLVAWRSKGLPGALRWLRSEGDLGPLLDALGVERDAMIPIHALVDGAGWLRCVRVGAIHEQDWAAVKGMLAR